MSFIRFQSQMSHYARWILWAMLVVMVITTFYWLSPNRGGPERGGKRAAGVLKVDGKVIGEEELRPAEDKVAPQLGGQTLAAAGQITYAATEQLIEKVLLDKAIKENRIRVSGAEVSRRVSQMVEQEMQANFPNRVDLKSYLVRRKLTLEDLKKDLRARQSESQVEEQLALEKLRAQVTKGVQVSDEDIKEPFTTVSIRIVPFPWEGGGEAQAKAKAEEMVGKARGGADFAPLAEQYGDQKAPKRERARVSTLPLQYLPPEVRRPVAQLQPNQVSDPIKMENGYYVVQLVEKKVTPPADFEQKKDSYRSRALEGKTAEAWDEYRAALRKKARVQYLWSSVEAAVAAAKGETDRAIALFQRVEKQAEAEEGVDLEKVYFSLGSLWEAKGDWVQAAANYQRAVSEGESAEAYIALAGALDKQGKRAEALQALANAQKQGSDDLYTRSTLASVYREMGEKALAAEEEAWVEAKQAEGQTGGPGPGE